MTWAALAAGVFGGITGSVTLGRRTVTVLPWLDRGGSWQRVGWSQILFGIFVLVETVPRLANGSAGLILGLSLAALIPLAGSVALQASAQRSRS
jgi:hypothetical protein